MLTAIGSASIDRAAGAAAAAADFACDVDAAVKAVTRSLTFYVLAFVSEAVAEATEAVTGERPVERDRAGRCVVRDVPEAAAPDRLVDLIREHDRWDDAPEGAT